MRVMKCQLHKEVEAVNSCIRCGRQLCSQCVVRSGELTFCNICMDSERSKENVNDWENEGGASDADRRQTGSGHDFILRGSSWLNVVRRCGQGISKSKHGLSEGKGFLVASSPCFIVRFLIRLFSSRIRVT